jgi:NAD(P)-dependent dehydrogenase (short-subunit alcohol dehydrogenase family)
VTAFLDRGYAVFANSRNIAKDKPFPKSDSLALVEGDTPMHQDDPREFLKTLQPMGQISAITDIVNAVLYLTDAGQVTGEVLRVDGGSHVGKW